MDIQVNLDTDDIALIISNLADSARKSDADADNYYRVSEKNKSQQYYQLALLAKIICRQDDAVVKDFMETLKTELVRIKTLKDDTENNMEAFIDLIGTMKNNSTEGATSMYMHNTLDDMLSDFKNNS